MRPRSAGLWRHPDFLKLWSGQIVSAVGNQVGGLALPLLAIIALHADARQMGSLRAAERLPFLLLALVVGVWVDRRRRRPLLITADLGRGALVGAVALGGLLGRLAMRDLYVAAFLVGVLTVCFDVGYQSYFPGLVGRARLVEGNSAFVVSGSLVRIAGPGLAGALVQALGAPLTLLADALSFVVSALSLGAIRAPEPAPPTPEERRRLWGEIREGLRLILSTPLLWANAACRATLVFSGSVVFAVYLLYLNPRAFPNSCGALPEVG